MAEVDDIKRKPGRWLRIVLFVSLALNLLVVGVLAGFALNGPPQTRGDRGDPVLPYTRAFEEDQRREIWRALRRSLPRNGDEMRDRYLSDYSLALQLLRSETFDAARMETLLAEQVARGRDVRFQGQKVLTAFLANMSQEARLAYADRLEAELAKMRQHRVRDHGHDRDKGKDSD